MTDVGNRYVTALVAKDVEAVKALFAEEFVFSGMTPSRSWEATSTEELVDILFANWFEPQDVVEDVVAVETGVAVDRPRVDYTLRVRTPAGLHQVEQRSYFDLDANGRIERMSTLCSGFRLVPEPTS